MLNKVSVIIPVYNTEEYVGSCIKSLLNQTYENIEIIIVNDGSTDNSLAICKEYANKDNRIIIKSIKNSGVSTARNIGLDLVTGTYVMFVDSDDWIENNTVQLGLEHMINTESEIVIWSYYKSYKDNNIKKSLIPGGSRNFEKKSDKEILYLKSVYSKYGVVNDYSDVSVGTVMCKLYRTEFINKYHLRFNPKLIRSEDVIFALYAFYHATKITYFEKHLYHYRMNESSICAGNRFISNTRKPFDLLLQELIKFQEYIPEVKEYGRVFDGRTIQALLWHLKYNYYHIENTNSIWKRRKEVLNIINYPPYKKALREIDTSLIPKQEKLMVLMFRKKLIVLHCICQRIIERRNDRKAKYFE